MTSSSNPPASKVKRIADEQILGPCWLWHADLKRWQRLDPTNPIALSCRFYQHTHWHPDQPEAPKEVPDDTNAIPPMPCMVDGGPDLTETLNAIASRPADLPAPASEEAKDLGGEARAWAWLNKRVCCNGSDCACAGLTHLQRLVYEEIDRMRKAHPTTDEAIAREAAHEIIRMAFTDSCLPEGSIQYERTLAPTKAIILRALSRVSPSALKKAELGTARTDAEEFDASSVSDSGKEMVVPADFARTLERELNDLQRYYDMNIESWKVRGTQLATLTAERDEKTRLLREDEKDYAALTAERDHFKASLAEMAENRTRAQLMAVALQQKVEALTKERDALQDEVEHQRLVKSASLEQGADLRQQLTAALSMVEQMKERETVGAQVAEALLLLHRVIESAGVQNLTKGVQLGQLSWFHKASDAMAYASASLSRFATLPADQPKQEGERK